MVAHKSEPIKVVYVIKINVPVGFRFHIWGPWAHLPISVSTRSVQGGARAAIFYLY